MLWSYIYSSLSIFSYLRYAYKLQAIQRILSPIVSHWCKLTISWLDGKQSLITISSHSPAETIRQLLMFSNMKTKHRTMGKFWEGGQWTVFWLMSVGLKCNYNNLACDLCSHNVPFTYDLFLLHFTNFILTEFCTTFVLFLTFSHL